MELKIEYVKPSALHEYKNNAREHHEADVNAIAASIKEFGFNDPIGVWNDEIVEGHGRLLAAIQLGLKKVPIIRLDSLTDEQRKAYALAHNKTAGRALAFTFLLAIFFYIDFLLHLKIRFIVKGFFVKAELRHLKIAQFF